MKHGPRSTAKVAVGVAITGVALSAFGATAWAAPAMAKNALPLTLNCDNGQTYTAVVNGGGGQNSNSSQTYNPAHVLDSNTVLIPVSFGESTYSFYRNGELIDQENQPAAAKGNGNVVPPTNATQATCTYSFEQSQTDPNTGDVYTFVGSGTVTGFIPGTQAQG